MIATLQIANHLNIAESAIVRVEEWDNVLFVVCRKIRARFVSKKVAVMSHYEKLVARFTEAGNDANTAKKAALFVLQVANDYLGFSEIECRFAEKHHAFIKQIICERRIENEAAEKAADAVADAFQDEVKSQWESLDAYCDSLLKGSEKQKSWARSIRGFAIENWLAPAVATGEMSFDEAVSRVKNPDCRYWIDNRKEWGCR